MKSHLFPLFIFTVTAAISPQALQSSRSRQDADNDVPQSCPVTKPSAHPSVPPAPYPNDIGPDSFWFGTSKLWAFVHKDGIWKGLPHYRPTDTAYRNKLFWWREGYDGMHDPQPKLKVTGERLDAAAPPLQSDEQANAGWKDDSKHPFIVAGIDIPTLGCWKITGSFRDEQLSYVVWVTQ
jgi:hypothetical protein